MGKLGKNARKFAKKNLQSVFKKQRKLKSLFKKRAYKKAERGARNTEEEEQPTDLSNQRLPEVKEVELVHLDSLFDENDNDEVGYESESDGYLSEGSDYEHLAHDDHESVSEEKGNGSSLAIQNSEIHSELAEKKKKLKILKDKDPKFVKFLESYKKGKGKSRNNDASDDDEASDDNMHSDNEDDSRKKLSNAAINSLCDLAVKQNKLSALTILLNKYRAACHCGVEYDSIQEGKQFSVIVMFVLREVDGIFRAVLGISNSNHRKEAIMELKKSAKWVTLKPLIKSYLRSTLFLLNQVTDSEILAFTMIQIKHSIVFFVAFPSLLQRFIKIAVHMWATGKGDLSLHSSLVLQDIVSVFGDDYFKTCFVKLYKVFIGDCNFMDPALYEHRRFLTSSFAKLCSLDVVYSAEKALVSIQHLAKILSVGLQTKNTESLKKICSWQYVNSIDLWVTFVAANIEDYDLQPLLFMITQIIHGVANLFPGSRYLPLKLKCIQWLNDLSISSGIFIPVASFALDVLEYSVIGKEEGKLGEVFHVPSNLKLPKNWLKSRNFQQVCVSSAIEVLAAHFSQWSFRISFPELATIPLIRLKKFIETTHVENFRRVVKRFIDQVEQNIKFVQKKRDEVAYSPKDLQSADSFLQLEKTMSASFTQYYKSIIEKAGSRTVGKNQKNQSKAKKKQQPPNNIANVSVNANGVSEKRKAKSSLVDESKGKNLKKVKA
ncbi:hypothetical protein ACFE04_015480 [Oxalis oulophora]